MRMMIFAAASLLAISGPASAATVITFDGVMDYYAYPDLPPETYLESGYSIGGGPASLDAPGSVHLDDAGSPLGSYISVTTGGLFSALAVQILGLGQASLLEVEETETTPSDQIPTAHENVWFKGFLNGVMVVEQGFSTGLKTALFDVRFGPAFAVIDRFEIVAETRLLANMICYDAPCGHFVVDNLIVGAPAEVIPVPAAGWLLAGGIGALLLRRRRGIRG